MKRVRAYLTRVPASLEQALERRREYWLAELRAAVAGLELASAAGKQQRTQETKAALVQAGKRFRTVVDGLGRAFFQLEFNKRGSRPEARRAADVMLWRSLHALSHRHASVARAAHQRTPRDSGSGLWLVCSRGKDGRYKLAITASTAESTNRLQSSLGKPESTGP